ncbi:MAG: hypothetical protein HS109_16560 [Burkholderiales bacterium]|nr:hypothetical protein [Burkholderiales bacterium]
MVSPELENLARIGQLKREPPTDDEIAGLKLLAEERLTDVARIGLSYSSRVEDDPEVEDVRAEAALRIASPRAPSPPTA